MNAKMKVKTPLFFMFFFALVIFTVPMTLYAGSLNECPCYTVAEVMKYTHPTDAVFETDNYWYWMRELDSENYNASFGVVNDEDSFGEQWLYCVAHLEDSNGGEIFERKEYIGGDENGAGACFRLLQLGLRLDPLFE